MQDILRLTDSSGPTDALQRLEAFQPLMDDSARMFLDQMRKVAPIERLSVVGLDADGYRLGTGTILWTNLPASYLAIYFGEKICNVDWTLRLAMARQSIATDADVHDGLGECPPDPRIAHLLRHYGVRFRTFVPISRAGRAYGGVVATSQRPLTEDEKAYLAFVAQPLHATLSRPYMECANAALRLTRGEMLCLRLASDGHTSEEISSRSSYSVETVNSYLKVATRKLGASNRLQAVAEALRRGIIA